MNRRAIAAALAAAVVVGTGSGWLATDAHAAPLGSSTIAQADGSHHVGRVDTELVDSQQGRRIMVSAWYPTASVGAASLIPAHGLAATARIARTSAIWMHAPATAPTMAFAMVSATQDAPADTTLDRMPVVVLSPGLGTPRWILSGLADDLASAGRIVIVIDHIGESPAVQLPDGEIITGAPTSVDPDYMRERLAAREDDMRLILDQLPTLPVVGPLADLERIAVGGHSLGGTTAVQLAAADPRVRAVVMIDAPAGWPGAADAHQLAAPVLELRLSDPWPAEWPHQPGADVSQIWGAGHYSATDLCVLGGGTDLCGTVPAAQATSSSRALIGSWLDTHQEQM
ncbi:alpha/beta hydrolase family protein [Nocardia nova SH22a]|uniref:Alpha/beta hydrolase family protein n=1 Tax=Nocardia nova SH22a TaxID=1415166 RepID=W5TUP1_9NOCA|nr:alpha/beta fold hydrolase [Nocardia nova]AHH20881.1 alpha/beta hydrolase family protein [Nocardia nova SH22a]